MMSGSWWRWRHRSFRLVSPTSTRSSRVYTDPWVGQGRGQNVWTTSGRSGSEGQALAWCQPCRSRRCASHSLGCRSFDLGWSCSSRSSSCGIGCTVRFEHPDELAKQRWRFVLCEQDYLNLILLILPKISLQLL